MCEPNRLSNFSQAHRLSQRIHGLPFFPAGRLGTFFEDFCFHRCYYHHYFEWRVMAAARPAGRSPDEPSSGGRPRMREAFRWDHPSMARIAARIWSKVKLPCPICRVHLRANRRGPLPRSCSGMRLAGPRGRLRPPSCGGSVRDALSIAVVSKVLDVVPRLWRSRDNSGGIHRFEEGIGATLARQVDLLRRGQA